MNIILFVVMIGMIVFAGIKLFLWLLERSVPILFRKQLKRLDKERQANINFLKNMGVEIVPDSENVTNYTSIR